MNGTIVEWVQHAGWVVPVGMTPNNLGVCRGCDARVLWVTTAAGKRMPIDRDGTSHFATCPMAARRACISSFRRPRP